MKRLLKWILIIGLIFCFFLFIAYLFVDALLDTEPVIPSNGYVHMYIGGSLPEYRAPNQLQEYLYGVPLDMKKIRQNLKMAAVDNRVRGILLELNFIQTGFSKLHELHQLISTFRNSGKKVLAFIEFGMTRDYYIATACDSIYMPPEGTLLLTGISAEISFYKDLLAKIGVEADFEHVGKYKNAPDIFTRQNMSEPMREVMNNLLDERFMDITNTISKNRNFSTQQTFKLIDEVSGFDADDAIKYQLIDGIAYKKEIVQKLKSGSNEISKISAHEYARLNPSTLGLEKGPRIAVVYCSGTIASGEDGTDPVFGENLGATRVVRDINRAAEINSIKAIILRIDSPGGSYQASDNIWHAINEAKKKKPVGASISDVGASGGYYIALAADTIVAQEPSLVGSIGIYIGKFSLQNLYNKIGIGNTVLRRGKNAGLFSLNNKFSDSERKVIKRLINISYQKFVSKVSESRNKTYEQINEIAGGRVWTGIEGLKNGLIDTIGGMDKSIQLAKFLAGIEPEKNVKLVYYPKAKSFVTEVLRNISLQPINLFNPVNEVETFLEDIQSKPIALMPFEINFK